MFFCRMGMTISVPWTKYFEHYYHHISCALVYIIISIQSCVWWIWNLRKWLFFTLNFGNDSNCKCQHLMLSMMKRIYYCAQCMRVHAHRYTCHRCVLVCAVVLHIIMTHIWTNIMRAVKKKKITSGKQWIKLCSFAYIYIYISYVCMDWLKWATLYSRISLSPNVDESNVWMFGERIVVVGVCIKYSNPFNAFSCVCLLLRLCETLEKGKWTVRSQWDITNQ